MQAIARHLFVTVALCSVPVLSGQTPGAQTPQAKNPGTVRIGVAAPQAQLAQGQGNGATLAEPIRAQMIKYLSGPAVEVVPITAMIPFQIDAEAKQKQCDFILYSTVEQKKNNASSKRGLLRGASSMANMAPMMGAARGTGGMVAATAAQSAVAGVAEAASVVKAKDEWSFGYKLVQTETQTPVLTNTASAKAAADGEDVITPMLLHAAQTIVTQVAKK